MYINNIYFRRNVSQRENFDDLCGFCLGFNEDLVIADPTSHRIRTFDKLEQEHGNLDLGVHWLICYITLKCIHQPPFLHSSISWVF